MREKIKMDQWRNELCTYNAIGLLIAEFNWPLMSRGVGVHFHQWFRIQCVCLGRVLYNNTVIRFRVRMHVHCQITVSE